MVHDHGFGDDAPGVAGEVFEQAEFEGLDVDPLRSPVDLSREQVDREVSDRDGGRFRGGGGAAQQRLDPGEQFREGKRFDQVVVTAVLESLDPVLDRIAGAEHDHRQGGARGAQFLDHGEAVHLRQHDVDDRQVAVFMARLEEAVRPVGGVDRGVSGLGQPFQDEFRGTGIILNQ